MCAPLLIYFYVCSATVLENQDFSTQSSGMLTAPNIVGNFQEVLLLPLEMAHLLVIRGQVEMC